MSTFGSKRQEQVIQRCFEKDCNDEVKPIRFRGKMMWECKVHGIYNKLGKKILSY